MAEADWRQLIALAAQQRVRPLVYRRLAHSHVHTQIPAAAWHELAIDVQHLARRLLHMHSELQQLLATLGAADIPAIVLKGGCLSTLVYHNLTLREMTDLDLLVPRAHLQRAVDLVAAQGYGARRSFSVELDTATSNHVTRLFNANGTALELHWNITKPCEPFTIDPSDLWRRTVPYRLAATHALSLSPEDLILHLCVHWSYHHQCEFGLRPLCDIAHTIDRFPALDWDAVCQRTDAAQWRRGVALALWLAREMLGAQAPDRVFDRLAPAGISQELLDAARAQVWCRPALTRLEHGLSTLALTAGTGAKLGLLWRRIFVSESRLAQIYGQAQRHGHTSGWLYVRRLRELLAWHGRSAYRLFLRRDVELLSLVQRRKQIHSWLAGR